MHLLKISSCDYGWLINLTDEFRERHNLAEGEIIDHAVFCKEYGITEIVTTPLPGHRGVITNMAFGFENEAELLLFVMRYKQ